MRISTSPLPNLAGPGYSALAQASVPGPAGGEDPQDQVQIQSAQAAKKKAWRQLEWASFGGQLVGGALVLAHQGAIGLTIFAASSATMVYAGYKGQRV